FYHFVDTWHAGGHFAGALAFVSGHIPLEVHHTALGGDANGAAGHIAGVDELAGDARGQPRVVGADLEVGGSTDAQAVNNLIDFFDFGALAAHLLAYGFGGYITYNQQLAGIGVAVDAANPFGAQQAAAFAG